MEDSLSIETVHPKSVFSSMNANNMRESHLLDNFFVFCFTFSFSEKQKQACIYVDLGYLFQNCELFYLWR